MKTTYSEWANTGFVVLLLVSLVFLLLGIRATYTKMRVPVEKIRTRLARIEAFLAVWIIVICFMTSKGILSNFSSMPPTMVVVIFPPLIALVVLLLQPKVKNFLLHTPLAGMMYFQVFRLPVEVLLWMLHKDGVVPVQMTFEGRNWDIVTGITGPPFAYICFGNGRNLKTLAIAWNFVGLILLVNIVGIAILSMPTPFRVFMNEPANIIVTQFPVVFLPAVLVPLAYYLHVFSLNKLLCKESAPVPESTNF